MVGQESKIKERRCKSYQKHRIITNKSKWEGYSRWYTYGFHTITNRWRCRRSGDDLKFTTSSTNLRVGVRYLKISSGMELVKQWKPKGLPIGSKIKIMNSDKVADEEITRGSDAPMMQPQSYPTNLTLKKATLVKSNWLQMLRNQCRMGRRWKTPPMLIIGENSVRTRLSPWFDIMHIN